MPGQNTHQNEVEDFKSGKIYHLGELSDNLRTWLLLFHTFSWAWESGFRILSSSQLWTRSPAIGRKCPRRNIFYQEASSREESCWDWFQMTKPSWSIECYFSLEFKRHKGDLCSQGGGVFRGSWIRGKIGKLFITPFISTRQTKRRGSLNVWDAFKSFNLLKNWRVLMYFVLLEILDSKLWLQKTIISLKPWKPERKPFGQLCNCRVSHKYWECGSVHCGC